MTSVRRAAMLAIRFPQKGTRNFITHRTVFVFWGRESGSGVEGLWREAWCGTLDLSHL